MKITNFEVKERKLQKLNSVTYTGDLNVDTFHFNFDDEWNGLDKTLVIISDVYTYNIPLLNDEAVLPNEVYVSNQSIGIGVFGRNENVILSSNVINIWINKGAYLEGQEPSNLPTATQWDLYIEEINRLLNEAKATEEECQKLFEEIRTVKQKIEEYDLNHEQKIEEYNENAEVKVNELNIIFNENVENKTNEFNNKAQAKIEELNTVFNENAESKKQELYDSIKNELNDDFMQSFKYVDELKNQLEYDSSKWGEVLESKKQGVNFMTEYEWEYGYINTSNAGVNSNTDTNWAHTDFIPTFGGAIFNFTNISTGHSTVAVLSYYDKDKKYLSQYTEPLVTGNYTHVVPEDDNIAYVRVCLAYRTAENFQKQGVVGGAFVCINTPKENIDNIYKRLNEVNNYASETQKGMVRVWTETVGSVTTLYISTEEGE